MTAGIKNVEMQKSFFILSKKCLAKANYHDPALALASHAIDFVQNIVYLIKEFNCCDDAWTNCIESTNTKEML